MTFNFRRWSPWVAARYTVLILLAVVMAAPFIWMVATSFKHPTDVFSTVPNFLPQDRTTKEYYLSFDNYKTVLDQFGLWQAFQNSLFVNVILVPSKLFLGALAAYAFARIEFPGRDKIFLGLLSSLMIPGIALLVPRYYIIKTFGLTDSLWGIIVPALISMVDIFLMRQFFMTLPRELDEAAMIDGAGRFRIFTSIIIPLSQPVLAVVTISSFIYHWNDFTWPLIVLTTPSKLTLPIALAALSSGQSFKPTLVMAGATFSVIPLVVIVLIFQKRILEGISFTGIKG